MWIFHLLSKHSSYQEPPFQAPMPQEQKKHCKSDKTPQGKEKGMKSLIDKKWTHSGAIHVSNHVQFGIAFTCRMQPGVDGLYEHALFSKSVYAQGSLKRPTLNCQASDAFWKWRNSFNADQRTHQPSKNQLRNQNQGNGREGETVRPGKTWYAQPQGSGRNRCNPKNAPKHQTCDYM